MPFNSALSSGAYDTLRGTASVQSTYFASLYMSLCPNTIKFAARVNQASFAASYAAVTFDTVTTGAYTDIRAGMTILIGSTSDPALAEFVGRIRANNSGVVSTSTTVNINETSFDLADNWYIFVIEDYRLWDKLGRDVSGVSYKDYDHTFIQLRPIVYNLKSAYAGWVSGSVLTLSFAPLAVAATSGASISTWLWDVGDGTITVGSASTQNITATFPAGFRWIHLTVTDNGSRSIMRHIPVWAHDPASYPPQLLGGEQFQTSKTVAGGVDATVTAFANVSGVYDNTLVVAWSDETYQDATTALTGDNIAFVGRFKVSTDVAQGDDTYALVSDTRYTLEGVLTQMARFEQLPYEFLYKASPTVWGEVKNLTLWRAIWLLLSEHSTFGELHSLQFDSTADTFLVNGLRTQGGNILSAVNDLAVSINAALQANAAGRCEVVRDARMLSTSARNALTTVANWTASDLLDISYEHRQINDIGRLKATGGAYNTSAGNFNTYEALAPGVAQYSPEGSGQLERQVLTANANAAAAQLELNTRAGDALALADNPDTLTVTHPDGYHWLIPALDQWYTFTLDGTETTRGIVLTTATRWLLTSVTVSHDSVAGTKEVQCTYVRETVGTPGQTVTYPPVSAAPLTIPTFPPFNIYPAFPIDPSLFLGTDPTGSQIPVFSGNPNQNVNPPPADGNTVMIATAAGVWITETFLKSANPNWVEVTPDLAVGESVIQASFSGFGREVYILTNTATDSYVYYRSDGFDLDSDWTQSAIVAGLYKVLRVGSTQGQVLLYCPDSSGGSEITISDSLTSGLGPQTALISATYPFGLWCDGDGGAPCGNGTKGGSWSASGGRDGNGSIVGEFVDRTITDINQSVCFLDLGTAQTITAATFWGAFDTSDASTYNRRIRFFDASKAFVAETTSANANPSYEQLAFSGSQAGVRYIAFESYANPSDAVGKKSYVDDISVTYGSGSNNALIAYSTDYGASFSQLVVGAKVGATAGMDTIKIGVQSLAAKSGQVALATTFGGAYSSYGSAMPAGAQPGALLIPRYKPGTTATDNTATNTPEFIVGSPSSSGNDYLWRVSASGVTYADITPLISGDYGKTVSPNDMVTPWYSGKIMAAIKLFNTTRKLVTTNDISGTPTWTARASLSSAADWILFRKGDSTKNQLFFLDGTVGVKYSPDRGVTITTKAYPSTDSLISLSVYG